MLRSLLCAVLILVVQAGVRAQDASAGQTSLAAVSSRVHIFYYDWYGAPPMQTSFMHWLQGGHVPPDDIGANFYPQLGAYSSTDPSVLKQHMQWIRQAHVGVLTVTWWGKGTYTDRNAKAVLDAAADAGLKVNFHIEPYPGRTPETVARDVAYILQEYGKHPAFYRADFLGNRPMFYVFESVRSSPKDWKRANQRLHSGPEPVAIIAQTSNIDFVREGDFDGGYTYDGLAPFRVPGFLQRWAEVARQFREAGKLFIPSVGPGYWDDRAVPVKGAKEPESARTRDNGSARTYDHAWRAAIQAHSPIITVTSFNEWHEGSQIEPAIEHRAGGYQYPSYESGPLEYLSRTAAHVDEYEVSREPISRSK